MLVGEGGGALERGVGGLNGSRVSVNGGCGAPANECRMKFLVVRVLMKRPKPLMLRCALTS